MRTLTLAALLMVGCASSDPVFVASRPTPAFTCEVPYYGTIYSETAINCDAAKAVVELSYSMHMIAGTATPSEYREMTAKTLVHVVAAPSWEHDNYGVVCGLEGDGYLMVGSNLSCLLHEELHALSEQNGHEEWERDGRMALGDLFESIVRGPPGIKIEGEFPVEMYQQLSLAGYGPLIPDEARP